MENLHVHAHFGIPNRGQYSLIAKILIANKKPENAKKVFEKKPKYSENMGLYHKNGKLFILLPNTRYLGRRLRKLLRDYAFHLGGVPSSLNFWLVPYRQVQVLNCQQKLTT